MKKIFFSYCWNDDEKYKIIKFVENLISQLKYSNNDYFLDRKVIKLGNKYWEKIYKAINTAQLFVFFNSKKYYNSCSCCKEYLWALGQEQNNNLTIIEIKLEDHTILYRPHNDQVYVKYNDKEIINKLNNAIFDNNFNGFEISDIYYDLNEISNSDGTITIKFKLLNNIDNLKLVGLAKKKDDQLINDIFEYEGHYLATQGGDYVNPPDLINCYKTFELKSKLSIDEEIKISYKNNSSTFILGIYDYRVKKYRIVKVFNCFIEARYIVFDDKGIILQ